MSISLVPESIVLLELKSGAYSAPRNWPQQCPAIAYVDKHGRHIVVPQEHQTRIVTNLVHANDADKKTFVKLPRHRVAPSHLAPPNGSTKTIYKLNKNGLLVYAGPAPAKYKAKRKNYRVVILPKAETKLASHKYAVDATAASLHAYFPMKEKHLWAPVGTGMDGSDSDSDSDNERDCDSDCDCKCCNKGSGSDSESESESDTDEEEEEGSDSDGSDSEEEEEDDESDEEVKEEESDSESDSDSYSESDSEEDVGVEMTQSTRPERPRMLFSRRHR